MKLCIFLVFFLCISSSLVGRDIVHHIVEYDRPVTVFAHGLGASYVHALVYTNLFCSKNWVAFNFPDAPERVVYHFSFDRGVYWTGCEHTGVAQTSEMDALEEAICSAGSRDLVLFGVSRGASTIVNVLGRMASRGADLSHIKLVVLESPFAHCRDAFPVIANILPSAWSTGIARSLFHEYDENQNIPLEWAASIPKHIPIMLIASLEDTVVPAVSTRKLYEHMKQLDLDVRYLELNIGKHALIAWDKEGEIYQESLRALYELTGLSCNESTMY